MENLDLSKLLGGLTDIFGDFDFSTLLQSIIEAAKKLFEMIQPMLGNLTGGTDNA